MKERLVEARTRKRTSMTPMQTNILQEIFVNTAFPSAALRDLLGLKLGIHPRTVQIWFQNQRQKIKVSNQEGFRNLSRSIKMVEESENETYSEETEFQHNEKLGLFLLASAALANIE